MKRSPLNRGTSELRRHTRLRQVSRKPKRRHIEEASPEAVVYKRFIRGLPCAGCGSTAGVDPHHAGHDHGLGQKAHWRTLIPLDRRCHDQLHDAKGVFADQPRRREWEIKVQENCQRLFEEWQAQRRSAGGFDLEMYALLAFSESLAWLKGRKESK